MKYLQLGNDFFRVEMMGNIIGNWVGDVFQMAVSFNSGDIHIDFPSDEAYAKFIPAFIYECETCVELIFDLQGLVDEFDGTVRD